MVLIKNKGNCVLFNSYYCNLYPKHTPRSITFKNKDKTVLLALCKNTLLQSLFLINLKQAVCIISISVLSKPPLILHCLAGQCDILQSYDKKHCKVWFKKHNFGGKNSIQLC